MKTAAITLVLFCLVASSVQFVLRSEFEDDALIGFEGYMRHTRDASSSESSEEKDVKSVVEGSGEEEELKLVFKREAITDTVEVEASGEEPSTVETRFKREAVVEGSGEEARFRREADLVAEASGEEPALL
uniref:DUF4794 domain-containing protein n=1 Tax=Panagrellus redivivus TaxID=6233 RepID=A0A7E4ZWF6_PANRE